jgi:type VI secretion system protein VasD
MRTLKAHFLAPLSRTLLPALMALAGLGMSGCADVPIPFMKKKPEPTLIEAKAVTSLQLNPDTRKRPSPVVVRVYELKARTQFDSADFISLFERDKDLLGGELVAREEFVMRPGETKELNRTPQADTKFLAVLVGYRDLEKARSRAVAAVEPNKTNRWVIKIEPLSVAILPAPAK